MKVIGITGPTGAGKTTALKALADLGAEILDADRVYHALLEEDAPLRAALAAAFGPDILDGEGRIDRRRLAGAAYPHRLAELNAITHPAVVAAIDKALAQARAVGRMAAGVDAIALVESGLSRRCDTVVAVLAPPEVRVRRIMERDGIDEAYARRRVEAQQPDGFYRAHADYVLENTGEEAEEDFRARARELFADILGAEGEKIPQRVEKFTNVCYGRNTQQTKEAIPMEEKEKTPGQLRREALLYQPKNGYDRISAEEETAMRAYCEDYKRFLDNGKTERECVDAAVRLAEAKGFRPFTRGMAVNPGDRLYRVNRGKAVMLAVVGSAPLSAGVNIAAAHIDNPRLDLKQSPVYEECEMAWMKTHYYGGIRKYQWVTIPLELHGVVALKDGSIVRVAIGAGAGDPLFTVDDLLPHLAADQNKKSLGEGISGEQLNILVGSRPFKDDEGADRVKLAILDILNSRYGITEEDFLSAELAAVPAFKACDIGFDRSLIGAYGHDDRVCSYAALAALLELETPVRTAICMLADKEEIGSEGVSGMQSAAFDTFMSDLCDAQRIPLKACYEKSFCLSADVCAAYDPNFAEVYEKRNSARINYGLALCKYTGSRGKSGASDASAEVVAYARKLFDEAGVVWQMTELGKVDQGGGGTVAKFLAQRDIDTLDAGVPVLSMHAPFETVSKLDCYMTYKGMKAVFEAK